MSAGHIFLHPISVGPSAIDENGHANNVEYVRWMQDAATSHSDKVGCTAACKAAGTTWVVRTHHIQYLRPAMLGDTLIVRTWVENGRRASSLRKYEFLRAAGAEDQVIAHGETDWVYVDAATGRPRSIPPEIKCLFGG